MVGERNMGGRKRKRDGEGDGREKDRKRQEQERERKIGRKTGVGEREIQGREGREGETEKTL